ncbi:MAG TPA: twin-arginine translocase TatA/TatE family subunit [Bryobacteraceae bacterium]|jgi:sec-independent protein translocase protein TatA|nr:twin-arginine translocase TatA/TatE family subunit [Bryobacteraceae bacterium]
MGPVGFPEMFAIFIIALLLFGPKKLPELGRTLGKALSEFRRAKNELKTTFESHLQELERETKLSEISSSSSSSSSSAPSSSYSYPYEDYNPYNAESPAYAEPAHSTSSDENRLAAPADSASEPAEEASSIPMVSGTVARSNGVRPLNEQIETTSGEHSEPRHEEHTV